MEFITERLMTLWSDTPLEDILFYAFALCLLAYFGYQRLTSRCSKCGGRFKKTYPDSTIWERITDKMTPEWQYERVRSTGVFECQNCQHRTKYLES